MEMKLDVYINDSETRIEFDGKKGGIKISDASSLDFNAKLPAIYLLLKENNLMYIEKEIDNSLQEEKDIDKVIAIIAPAEINLEDLKLAFINEAIQNEIKLKNKKEIKKLKNSDNINTEINEYKDKVIFILKSFGYDIFKLNKIDKDENKASPAKARHKWTKEISQIEFTAKVRGGEGTAIWKSRDKLVLLAGAKLTVDPQLNKDGSLNYSAQFAQKLRNDYLDKVVNNCTTEDIEFPSPNVLGLFLFYGGQNTWAELKDKSGKSLDDWSRVD